MLSLRLMRRVSAGWRESAPDFFPLPDYLKSEREYLLLCLDESGMKIRNISELYTVNKGDDYVFLHFIIFFSGIQ